METKDEKRTVIVTGGTKGIGAAVARKFHDRGYYVLIGARHDNGLAKELGARARFKSADVRIEADHIALAQAAVKWTGRLDVYINCAGFSAWRPVADVDEAFWDEMIATNLKGAFWGCKAAAAHLDKSGCIINVSSLAGKRGSANNSVYCASKFGVNGITQSLAKELGPRGIRVNAVCPVYVKTDGLYEALAYQKSPGGGEEINSFLQKFASKDTALGRIPTADEVAEVCVFLASPAASAITGQCINVDCGVLPQ